MNGPTSGHSRREYTRLTIHPSGRIHPEQSRLVCEAPGCRVEVSPAASYSFVVTLATTGGPVAPGGGVVGAFACGDEQHFCCSPACARAATLACIDHLVWELETRRAALAQPSEPEGEGA